MALLWSTVDSLWGWVQWKGQLLLCEALYNFQEEDKIPIPPHFEEDDDPLTVFLDTHIEVNVFRWVVFMLWLKTHPEGYKWFRII